MHLEVVKEYCVTCGTYLHDVNFVSPYVLISLLFFEGGEDYSFHDTYVLYIDLDNSNTHV